MVSVCGGLVAGGHAVCVGAQVDLFEIEVVGVLVEGGEIEGGWQLCADEVSGVHYPLG